ncbi:ImmA/IrrE family metallo-endopeptidase [Actinacidiphila glaucinigra]|uniref:ImmA/IrrE family metallo-endopeptidase n=1 Tax=Actinacidiphila glaucinigra TaxID=235986 RepID=UPI0036E67D3F
MVNYVLATAAQTQAAAMMAELETQAPGASQRLARSALSELRSWPDLTVQLVAEGQTGARCSVAGAYLPGPPPRIAVADAASPTRRDFTALHELGHHLQRNSFDLMDAFEGQEDGGLILEDAACDAFAAEILLPASLVDSHLAVGTFTASDAVDLWRAGGASRMAVCVRTAQRLPAPGHVLLLEPGGRVAFASSHGLPPVKRGSPQGDIPVIEQALAGKGRANGLTRLHYRDGIQGQELYVQTAPMSGYLLALLVTDLAPWRAFAPSIPDTGPQAGQYICEHCHEEYHSFAPACSRCHIPTCPECGRCGCASRVAERLCKGCFISHTPTMFAPDADRCIDCS